MATTSETETTYEGRQWNWAVFAALFLFLAIGVGLAWYLLTGDVPVSNPAPSGVLDRNQGAYQVKPQNPPPLSGKQCRNDMDRFLYRDNGLIDVDQLPPLREEEILVCTDKVKYQAFLNLTGTFKENGQNNSTNGHEWLARYYTLLSGNPNRLDEYHTALRDFIPAKNDNDAVIEKLVWIRLPGKGSQDIDSKEIASESIDTVSQSLASNQAVVPQTSPNNSEVDKVSEPEVAETPQIPETFNGFACDNLYTSQPYLAWDKFTGIANDRAKVVWNLTSSLLFFEKDGYLHGYAPPVNGVSSVCVIVGGAGPYYVDGKGTIWLMSPTAPGVMELGNSPGEGRMVTKKVTIYPVELPVQPTSIRLAVYPTWTPVPQGEPTPIPPTATLPRPPQPACSMISWNNLLANIGENYQLFISRGDTYLMNNGWVTDSVAGPQMEWRATTGTQSCYFVTNIPATVEVMRNEVVYADGTTIASQPGTWKPENVGAVICINGPCQPNNSFEGRVGNTNIYTFPAD